MKVTVEPVKKTPKYPRLMVSKTTGIIILFWSRQEGVVLDSGTTKYAVGHYSTYWKCGLEPFEGKVVLES